MLNKIIVQGRMVRDAELRSLPSGKPVTSFTVACDRDFRGEANTDFIDIVAFNNTAEFVCNHLGKGRTVLIEGRLQIREWTDKNGNKRRNAEILADRVHFGDSKRTEAPATTPQYTALEDDYEDVEDGELPF